MIHCINCVWANECLDLDDPNFPNEQIEECENYVNYKKLGNYL